MTPVTVIAGAGPGNGRALARRFAQGGEAVALLARSPEALSALAVEIEGLGGRALAVPVDLSDADAVGAAFARVQRELGPVTTLIQNAAGGFGRGPFLELPLETFRDTLAVTVLGTVYCCRAVLPAMAQQGQGNIVVIGATGSLRGGAGFSAFAVGKAGQRMLAQSLAREFGPQGVHVAHVVIDGVVDNPRSRARLPEQPASFFLRPQDIAEAVWHLTRQPRSAWTHELDLRPFGEKF